MDVAVTLVSFECVLDAILRRLTARTQVDDDGNGEISFPEFVAFVATMGADADKANEDASGTKKRRKSWLSGKSSQKASQSSAFFVADLEKNLMAVETGEVQLDYETGEVMSVSANGSVESIKTREATFVNESKSSPGFESAETDLCVPETS